MLRFRAHHMCAASLLVSALLLACTALAAQRFSHILSFQGRLCAPDGLPLPDGQYQVRFVIYNTPTGGRSLWTEMQTVDQVGGILDVYLGTEGGFPSALFTDGDRWLALQVIGDDEMAERVRLVPSPQAIYAADSAHAAAAVHATDADAALYADDADTVDGLHGAAFVTLAPGGRQTGAAIDLAGGDREPTCRLQSSALAFAATTTAKEMDWSWWYEDPPDPPRARMTHAMAYNVESDRVILFGGYGAGYLGDTWAYDCDTDRWTQTDPDNPPVARSGAAMASDSESDAVMLFGGMDSTNSTLDDTWAFGLYNTIPVAEFHGSVHIHGGLVVEGDKNAVVPTESFGERKVYCQESTEVWFEHIGRAELQDGKATVHLDAMFLETMIIDDAHPMHVLVTPTSGIDKLYVIEEGDSFTVVSKTDPTGSFNYRVVAKRRGYEDAFMEPTGRR
jgi:hypothetical protein